LLNLYEGNDFNLLVIVIIQKEFASSPGKRYTNGASITAMKSGVLFLFLLCRHAGFGCCKRSSGEL
jgi:hypothetical protein